MTRSSVIGSFYRQNTAPIFLGQLFDGLYRFDFGSLGVRFFAYHHTHRHLLATATMVRVVFAGRDQDTESERHRFAWELITVDRD